MSHIIWDRSDNPTEYASGELGITREQLRVALYKMKRYSNIGATGRIFIYNDGRVTDANGNILDED